MRKKRSLIITLLFIILTSLEAGIFIEVAWHGWGGFGGVSKEYTATGQNGTSVLILFIPVIVIAVFLIRIIRCFKTGIPIKELLPDCMCALFGIGIRWGMFFLVPYLAATSPVFILGRRITSFLIDHFEWMKYPIP